MATKWMPASTPPRNNGSDVIVAYVIPGEGSEGAVRVGTGWHSMFTMNPAGEWFVCGHYGNGVVTHWRPFPRPPRRTPR